jgi:outer membrane receptor for ferrienterochelin and colicins
VDLNIESGEGKRILNNYQQIGDYAFFGSFKWDPVRQISVQPGLRLIYNTKYPAPLVYALSGKWSVNENSSLRLSFSKGFRAPSIKELYLYFVDINHNVQGNPDLESETSNNVNLNYLYNREVSQYSWSLELSAFYNHVENIITLARIPGVENLYSYINIDKYNSVNGQLGLTLRFHPSLTVQAAVSETGRSYYQDEQDNSSDFFFSTDVSANASYSFVKYDMTFALFYKYTGKTPQFLFEEQTISEAYLNPYNIMDFTITKGFIENLIRVSAGIKNIFNVTTVPAVGGTSGGGHGTGGNGMESIGWGRTVFVKLSVNFNKIK